MSNITPPRSRVAAVGWLMVLVGSGLLIFQGVTWYFTGPETALDNIAERVALPSDVLRREIPGVTASAFDVITIVARTQAVYGAALGLLTLLVAWRGYRHGDRAAWWACWVLPAAVGGAGLSFTLAGGAEVGAFYLAFAAVTAAALLAARRGLRSALR